MRRLNRTKRRMCIGAFTLVAAPLLLASVASACTQLKNLNANPGSGAAGATIQVTGTNYVKTNAGPVEIRLNTRTGEPLASLPAASITDIGGTISLAVTIPANAAAGYHTLIATQRSTANGALLNGFPVRATYRVTAAAAPRETSGSAAEAVPAAAAGQQPAVPAAPEVGTSGATRGAAIDALPVGADASAATPVTPAAATASATSSASASASASTSAANGSPAAPTGSGPGAGPPAAAGAVLETSTPALAAGATPTPALVTAGLVTAVAERSTTTLPQVMLAIGAAMVLLSLGASLTSGRSVFTGRRPDTLA